MKIFSSLKSNGFKYEILTTITSFTLGTTTTLLLLSNKADYYFIRDCIFTPHQKFKKLKEKNSPNSVIRQKYSFNQLMMHFKDVGSSFLRLTAFPLKYQFFRAQYAEKERLRALYEVKNHFEMLIKDINIKTSWNVSFRDKNFENSEDEEERVFEQNRVIAEKFVMGSLKAVFDKVKEGDISTLTDEEKYKISQPLVMTKDQFLSMKAGRIYNPNNYNNNNNNTNNSNNTTKDSLKHSKPLSSSLSLSEKIYLVEEKLSSNERIRRNDLWSASKEALDEKTSSIIGIRNISTLDDITDKKQKILEQRQREENLDKKRRVVNSDQQNFNRVVNIIKDLEKGGK